MLTAARGEAKTDKGIAAETDGYLVKPFNPEKLVEKVAAIIKNNLFMRSS